MNISKIEQLSKSLESNPWFHGVERDEFNRYVVFVDRATSDVTSKIPDKFEGTPVLVHFSAAKNIAIDNYVNSIKPSFKPQSEEEEGPPLDYLLEQIAKLQLAYDPDILHHIFFEIIDDIDAITNLSPKFPDVRTIIEELYKDYGFDVLYEQLHV